MRAENDLVKPLNCLNSMSERRKKREKLENQDECKYFGLRLEMVAPKHRNIYFCQTHTLFGTHK